MKTKKIIDPGPEGQAKGNIEDDCADVVQERDRQQIWRKNQDIESDELENAFQFSQLACGHDNAGCGGKAPQAGDNHFPGQDQESDPGWNSAHGNQHHQGNSNENLVGQRVHQLAKNRFGMILTRQVAVGEIGKGAGQEKKKTKETDPLPDPGPETE